MSMRRMLFSLISLLGRLSPLMKNSKALKLWSRHNLPDEIWLEILSRLPVKSLLRFRSVSPSWKKWIDDPSFTRLHLNRYNNRSDSPIPFVQGSEFVVKKSQTLRTILSLGILQSDVEPVDVARWVIVSSIDGLFLLQCPQRLNLLLWNPSIRKTLALPPAPQIPSLNYYFTASALGFDSMITDYKVVRSVLLGAERLQFVTVYTLKTNSWKVINCPLTFHPWESSVNLHGILYGVAKDFSTRVTKLVSLDWSIEAFAFFELPETFDDQAWTKRYLTTVDDGCSLALVILRHFKGSIWVMKRLGDKVSWIQRYTFETVPPNELYDLEFLCIKKNGEMLIKWKRKVICYNFETQQRKILMEKNRKRLEAVNAPAYVESLIMHT